MRENARTGRTPQQVMGAAKRAVDAVKWDAPWGADADHLKTVENIPPFVDAGYTFFTVDPGEYVENAADTDPMDALRQNVAAFHWDELSSLYLHRDGVPPWGRFEAESLMRALVKYGKAIQHTVTLFKRLSEVKDMFDKHLRLLKSTVP